MIKDGCLDGVDHVFGIHVMSTMETGKIYYREGNIQTGRAYFKVKINGKGGHGSSPHLANDAIVAGSYFVQAVQTIISRRLNPFDVASITIGSFDGKGSFNVIKDSVELEGDVRVMTEETRELVEREIRHKLEGLQETFGITYELNYLNDYPVLYNDPKLTEFVAESLKNSSIPGVTGLNAASRSRHRRILLIMLRNAQAYSSMWERCRLTANTIHITILNSILTRTVCLLPQKRWAL